jgi:hypothetical protein
MVSIDGFDKGSQAPHVHSRPASQSIYPIDKSQPGANRILGDYDTFHFPKSKRDFVEIDRDLINFFGLHKVAGKEQSLLRRLFAICRAGTLLITRSGTKTRTTDGDVVALFV